jgi:hypothetical protein
MNTDRFTALFAAMNRHRDPANALRTVTQDIALSAASVLMVVIIILSRVPRFG